MRLFIAIDFNELKDYFIELQKLLPKSANLSLTKTFHLTLKFLGEVPPDKVGIISDNLRKIEFKSFPVHLDPIGIFPTENYIRVVWIGLNQEERILELQKDIDESLKSFFKKENDFKAHITLARVKYPEDKKLFFEQLKKIKIDKKEKEIKNFILIKSTLTPKGAVYEDVEIFNSNLFYWSCADSTLLPLLTP